MWTCDELQKMVSQAASRLLEASLQVGLARVYLYRVAGGAGLPLYTCTAIDQECTLG